MISTNGVSDPCELLLITSGVLQETNRKLRREIISTAQLLTQCIRQGHKLLVCGNGGSAADAQHFVADLVGRYRAKREGLPAINLASDASILTAVANDFNFEAVFARQITALGTVGDCLVGISTSGRSQNVLRAVQAARDRQMMTVALTGGAHSPLKELVDVCLCIPSCDTPIIQHVHGCVLHIIAEFLDQVDLAKPERATGCNIPEMRFTDG
jgi:D-sedoheptulose 7-phosphate isomerase